MHKKPYPMSKLRAINSTLIRNQESLQKIPMKKTKSYRDKINNEKFTNIEERKKLDDRTMKIYNSYIRSKSNFHKNKLELMGD